MFKWFWTIFSLGAPEKRGIFFATLQQNELNSDVVRFTTRVRTLVATNNMTPSFFFVMINRATSLFNSFEATLQKLHVLCCPFYCTLSRFDTYPRRPTVTQFRSRQSYGKIEDCKQSSLGEEPRPHTPSPISWQNLAALLLLSLFHSVSGYKT